MTIKGEVQMKRLKIVILTLCLALLLSGCGSFRIATSIEDLISPISPSGENAGVQSAVDEYCKSGYSLKIPSKGEYTTSFIFCNLYGDEQSEAVFFYEPSDALGTVNMAVLHKSSNKWSVVENIEGNATDVNSVDFCDLNNDGKNEIIVCWSVISKNANSKISVYKQAEAEGTYKLEVVGENISANDFICTDINSDGTTELLVFSIGTSSQSPNARLYSFENDYKKLLGETKLDSTIISFNSILCGKTDEGVSVYADAVKSNGESMLTEFIYWSDYYDSIVSPFYNYNTGKTSGTTRNTLVKCRDIDNDEVIEIPVTRTFANLPSQLACQDWVEYKNTILNHKCSSVSCSRDGYILVLDDDFIDEISLDYDNEKRTLTILSKDGSTEYFSIVTVLKSSYVESDDAYNGYSQVYANAGYVYLARLNNSDSFSITAENLKNMIKAY